MHCSHDVRMMVPDLRPRSKTTLLAAACPSRGRHKASQKSRASDARRRARDPRFCALAQSPTRRESEELWSGALLSQRTEGCTVDEFSSCHMPSILGGSSPGAFLDPLLEVSEIACFPGAAQHSVETLLRCRSGLLRESSTASAARNALTRSLATSFLPAISPQLGPPQSTRLIFPFVLTSEEDGTFPMMMWKSGQHQTELRLRSVLQRRCLRHLLLHQPCSPPR